MKLNQNVPIRDMSYRIHLSRSLSPSEWYLPVEKDVCSALCDRMSAAQISYVSGDPESRLALSITRTEVRATPVFHLMTESRGFWKASRPTEYYRMEYVQKPNYYSQNIQPDIHKFVGQNSENGLIWNTRNKEHAFV